MPDFSKIAVKALNILNPSKSTGKTLMVLNAIGIGFAAAANTFAAATDKNTSAEDKKFLVPAGGVTGLANLAIYFGMTKKIIDKLAGRDPNVVPKKKLAKMKPEKIKELGGVADKVVDIMKDTKIYEDRTKYFVEDKLLKASKKIKDPALLESMQKAFKNPDGSLTAYAKDTYRESIKSGLGVIGAFIGAVIGCAIITPILRDVSAYAVQKARELKDPSLKNKPYRPYFDISHIRAGKYPYGQQPHKPDNRPLSMTSYLNFTHGRTRV